MIRYNPINVLRYDKVVKALTDDPTASLESVSRRTGVALSTIRKIWEGKITRPRTIVLDRLKVPRRCPDCRGLCTDWPCIRCEMERRSAAARSEAGVNFVYRHGPR